MGQRRLPVLFTILSILAPGSSPGEVPQDSGRAISFKDDVMPVFKTYCLPCHAEESFNPSGLSLDTRELLMKGGEHGPAVIPGRPEASSLIRKLDENPPFGDRMPLARRRKSKETPKRLTENELRILTEWIRQGARGN